MNLKQLMQNSEILWWKSKKIITKKTWLCSTAMETWVQNRTTNVINNCTHSWQIWDSWYQYHFKIAFRCSNDNLGSISMLYVYLRYKGASTSQVIGARNEWWWMIMMAKWYSGTLGPKASWHLSYRWGKSPRKTSPRKLVPTGDRTRARCVTSAHATACSTAVDSFRCCWGQLGSYLIW